MSLSGNLALADQSADKVGGHGSVVAEPARQLTAAGCVPVIAARDQCLPHEIDGKAAQAVLKRDARSLGAIKLLGGWRLRRHAFRCLLLIAATCWFGATCPAWAADHLGADAPLPHPPRRNLVLITFDDLRQDTPGFNDGPAKTPHMDRLASMSTNFCNAMTTVGLCSPSRATLFTGRYGHQTGIDDNVYTWHSRLVGLADDESTLIEWSHRAGYFVGYFGKWHLGLDGPYRRGVDRPAIKGHRRQAKRIYRKPDGYTTIRRYYEPGRTFKEKPEYYGTRRGSFEDTTAYKYARQATTFLREATELDRPFVLLLNFHAPHPPYVVPKPFDTMYSPAQVHPPGNFLQRSDDKPRYQNDPLWYWHDVGHLTKRDWREMNSHYWGFVTMADRALGQLLETLAKLQLSDSTMVVLVGDQGSMLGEHMLYDKGPYCYDELMRIPLLIHVPGAKPGKVGRQVSIIDINQTVVDWLQLHPTGKPRFSRSLLPLIRQKPDAWSGVPDATFYRYQWYNGKWYGIRAVRTPHWKYCWNPVGIDELYDLKNDADEAVNRIDDPKAATDLQHLQHLLLDHLETTGDPAIRRFKKESGL